MSLPSYDSLIVTRLRAAGCVFAEDEARLLIRTAQNPGDLATMVERRIAGYPLEHVLGWAEFAPAAARCARRNLTPIGGHVYEGDLYAPLPDSLRGHVDVLVASPPYVPTDAIRLLPPEARDHEPMVTLDGGADGLQTVRRLIAEAPQWLAPGGYLLVETSERQAGPTMAAVSAAGLVPQLATDEERDATVVIGSRFARHN